MFWPLTFINMLFSRCSSQLKWHEFIVGSSRVSRNKKVCEHLPKYELFRNNGLMHHFLQGKKAENLGQMSPRTRNVESLTVYNGISSRWSQDRHCQVVNTTSSRVNDIRPFQIKVQYPLNHAVMMAACKTLTCLAEIFTRTFLMTWPLHRFCLDIMGWLNANLHLSGFILVYQDFCP